PLLLEVGHAKAHRRARAGGAILDQKELTQPAFPNSLAHLAHVLVPAAVVEARQQHALPGRRFDHLPRLPAVQGKWLLHHAVLTGLDRRQCLLMVQAGVAGHVDELHLTGQEVGQTLGRVHAVRLLGHLAPRGRDVAHRYQPVLLRHARHALGMVLALPPKANESHLDRVRHLASPCRKLLAGEGTSLGTIMRGQPVSGELQRSRSRGRPRRRQPGARPPPEAAPARSEPRPQEGYVLVLPEGRAERPILRPAANPTQALYPVPGGDAAIPPGWLLTHGLRP